LNGAKREWKGRSEAEGCTAKRGSLGKPLAGARAELPLAAFAVALAFQKIRAGVAGRNSPLRWGGGCGAAADGGELPPHKSLLFVTNKAKI